MLNYGVLGINARNISYIKKFNGKKEIRLANDKLATKKFLSERGIPFAKTYAVIKDRKQLFGIDFGNLPSDNFVIKPNRGSKGKGIYVVKHIGTDVNTQQQEEPKTGFEKFKAKIKKVLNRFQNMPNFSSKYKIGDNIVSDNQLRRYILDDLDGKNSMTNGNDKVIVEEKLIPGDTFEEFCKFGLADMRIIVFNLVPVGAMVRIPTTKSGGKANLAAGGIGAGIDIGTGIIKSVYVNHKSYTNKFPEEYKHLKGIKIPYRDDILLWSSKIQYFVNLGYLALDWVVTDDGPKLLEINARAGLELQNITGIKLANVLDKISGFKIKYPEKGVEVAKTLFSQEDKEAINQKILYLSQMGKLKAKVDDEVKYYNEILVKVDINKSESYVSGEIYEWIKSNNSDETTLLVGDNDIVIKGIKFLLDKNLSENEIVLGNDVTSNYLIKPINKAKEITSLVSTKGIEIKEKNRLHAIDDEISKISKKIILSSILKPINYIEEWDKFLSNNGKYNPHFKYNWPDDQVLQGLTKDLIALQDELNKNKYNGVFTKLFLNKIEELLYRINLITAYKKKDYKNILLYNEKLYGKIDNKLLEISKDKIFANGSEKVFNLGKQLSIKEVKDKIEKYLKNKGIEGVDIIVSMAHLTRISVIFGKKTKIKISGHIPFKEKELESILAHEIDTHLVRHINGSKTMWKIFKEGTGFYLMDEEGFAIFNEKKYLPNEYEKYTNYKMYFLISEAQKYSFEKLVNLASFFYPTKDLERIFKTIVKIKKGIEDTSIINEGAVYFKEKVYLDGYMKINDWVEKGNSIEGMYKGKIKLDDLKLIK